MALLNQRMIKTFFFMLSTTVLCACGGNPKKTIFNTANPSMESLLAIHGSQSLVYARGSSNTPVTRSQVIADSGSNEPEQNGFRELENPTLFLYIEPHVTRSGTYIPGITVPYKLYQQVEFALPGEW